MALGELGVPTLSDVYDMSWAEFRIRLFAYKRMQKNKIDLFRMHAFHAAQGGLYAFAPNKFPKTLDKFWKVSNTNVKDMQKRLEFLKQQQKKFKDNA